MRRIAAIVAPELACELVRQKTPALAGTRAPLAVILEREGALAEPGGAAILDVVGEEARRYGVRVGQKVADASALVASLAVHRVTFVELDAALGRIADLALGLGTTAAIELEHDDRTRERSAFGSSPFDTVWLDVTGAAHLVGGEEALLDELAARARSLGHRVRAAIADGPRLAQALARWASVDLHAVAPPGRGAEAIAELPLRALPIDDEAASFFVRLGVLTVRDLARLPRAQVAARLGAHARTVLELVAGRDATPLVPYAAPRVLVDEARFDDAVHGAEPLLFVLRGMTSRLSARLAARGEACTRLEVDVFYDASIARLRLAEQDVSDEARDARARALHFAIDLPSPLVREADLLRPLRTRLESVALLAPAVGVRLSIPQIVRAPEVQLDLSRDVAIDPDALPALLAELSAEIGAERVGVLSVLDAHRPEARSALCPVARVDAPRSPVHADAERDEEDAPGLSPTRLLPEPVPLGRVRAGAVVAVDQRLYAVESARFVWRLEGVEWWTARPSSRDYARVWLVAGDRSRRPGASVGPGSGEALVYVDRATGEYFLQGWCE
jgi:protein ImuB